MGNVFLGLIDNGLLAVGQDASSTSWTHVRSPRYLSRLPIYSPVRVCSRDRCTLPHLPSFDYGETFKICSLSAAQPGILRGKWAENEKSSIRQLREGRLIVDTRRHRAVPTSENIMLEVPQTSRKAERCR